MTDHSWNPNGASNKVGGDQFAMALSSWSLYYAYTGDTAVINNMKYIADTYLANSLSTVFDTWQYLPYPCNYTNTSKAIYDGDFLLGTGVTQPDKAGSFGAELVTLYKITGNTDYLNAAVNIANTLAAKVQPGDANNSPYPFKVNAQNGNVPLSGGFAYTGNVFPTLRLFEDLKALNTGNVTDYDSAYQKIKRWVKAYPQQNNNWGNFFEDILLPSNTEINAVTAAYYIMQHPDWSNTYMQDARSILNWTITTLGSHAYDTIGVTAIYEQSVDLKEGGSHTSRFASAELLYSELSGDTSRREQALRQLNWATYLCDTDGLCRFSPAEGSEWYTDGYGDYLRHFIRAMGSYPAIAPYSSNHLLRSSSVITAINYAPQEIVYNTFDSLSSEVLRLTSKPLQIKLDGVNISEQTNLNSDGWVWTPYATGGVLQIKHTNSHHVDILWYPEAVTETATDNRLTLYPNPAGKQFTVSFSATPVENMQVGVFDATGRCVQSFAPKLQGNKLTVYTDGLIPGIYFVKLQGEQIHDIGKIVIEK
jgi:hypothetical protein